MKTIKAGWNANATVTVSAPRQKRNQFSTCHYKRESCERSAVPIKHRVQCARRKSRSAHMSFLMSTPHRWMMVCQAALESSGCGRLQAVSAHQSVQKANGYTGVKKVVLAYSGGLDTSVILRWLQDVYGCEVVTFTADLGQGEELAPAKEKAEAMGVKDIYIEDLREEFVKDYVFPMFRANAIYEGYYLLVSINSADFSTKMSISPR